MFILQTTLYSFGRDTNSGNSPFQRLSIDFKGPLPQSKNGNKYLLTMIDEYSRFPFAYPCRDMTSQTVTHCFNHLFSIFGMPDMVHNDRATDFLSGETQEYLLSKSISTSKTSRYNPKCNGQVEKLNGTKCAKCNFQNGNQCYLMLSIPSDPCYALLLMRLPMTVCSTFLANQHQGSLFPLG